MRRGRRGTVTGSCAEIGGFASAMARLLPECLIFHQSSLCAGLCLYTEYDAPVPCGAPGKLWLCGDGPRKSGSYRTQEWVVKGVSPAEVDRVVRRESKMRFAISAMYATEEDGLAASASITRPSGTGSGRANSSWPMICGTFRNASHPTSRSSSWIGHSLSGLPRRAEQADPAGVFLRRCTNAAIRGRGRGATRRLGAEHCGVSWAESEQRGARTCTWFPHFAGGVLPGRCCAKCWR